jgi:hypothetical protein
VHTWCEYIVQKKGFIEYTFTKVPNLTAMD